MTPSAATAAAEHEVVRCCHSGLDVADLQHELLRSLRRSMPIDAAFFATADPETLLFTGAYAEDPLGVATPQFLDNEYGGDDVNTFASLARSARHVASLDFATLGDRASSIRYRDIMRPLGLGDEMRAALVAGSDCWGYLCLHREDDPLGFNGAEAALIARLGPHIGQALRQAVLLHHPPLGSGLARPGVVLLDDSLNLVATTADAEYLLSLIAPDVSSALPVPVAVYAVASALIKLETGVLPVEVLPSARVRAATGGWLNVHAARLQGPGGEQRIAVILEQAEPHATLPIMLAAYGLSAREQDVARLVLRGASTRAISGSLHISGHTVQDHLKSLFDKVGVRSRRDLVGLLLGAA